MERNRQFRCKYIAGFQFIAPTCAEGVELTRDEHLLQLFGRRHGGQDLDARAFQVVLQVDRLRLALRGGDAQPGLVGVRGFLNGRIGTHEESVLHQRVRPREVDLGGAGGVVCQKADIGSVCLQEVDHFAGIGGGEDGVGNAETPGEFLHQIRHRAGD